MIYCKFCDEKLKGIYCKNCLIYFHQLSNVIQTYYFNNESITIADVCVNYMMVWFHNKPRIKILGKFNHLSSEKLLNKIKTILIFS